MIRPLALALLAMWVLYGCAAPYDPLADIRVGLYCAGDDCRSRRIGAICVYKHAALDRRWKDLPPCP